MPLETRGAKALELRRSVLDVVSAQLLAGACHVSAQTVDPLEGELFRAEVRSELLSEPKIVSVLKDGAE